LPASANASRIEKNGIASTATSATASTANGSGRRCTCRLQRYQNPAVEAVEPERRRMPGIAMRSIR
jgi:hypothetical protein